MKKSPVALDTSVTSLIRFSQGILFFAEACKQRAPRHKPAALLARTSQGSKSSGNEFRASAASLGCGPHRGVAGAVAYVYPASQFCTKI